MLFVLHPQDGPHAEVDLAAGRVRITPPAGLFEELPPEADEALGGEVPEARTEQE